MPRIRLTGRTVPNIGIAGNGGPFGFHDPLIEFHVVSYTIVDASVSVECEVPNTTEWTLNLAYFYVFAALRSIVDAAAFSVGYGVLFFLDGCVMPDGSTRPLGYHDPLLKGICSISPSEMLRMQQNERAAFKHIHDLVETLVDPFVAPINCARAVEGFAQLLLPKSKAKQRWKRMQEALNVDESYLKPISEASEGPRHGEIDAQSFNIIFDIRKRSWMIASRFLEFRKRGNIDLCDPYFPRLLG